MTKSWLDEYFKYDLAAILKDAQSEHFAIKHYEVDPEGLRMSQLHARIHGSGDYDDLTVGTYVKLCRIGNKWNDGLMMSNTPMEKHTQYYIVREARGDVLIAGLGIGMVLLAIQDKPDVISVTVVEKEQEIIDLVKPQLPLNSKVTIVCADIFEYKAAMKFDTIYFDIWDDICGDNWEQMKKLSFKFRSRLKLHGFMTSWRKEECRYYARQD